MRHTGRPIASVFSYDSNSGSPATDVSMDTTPASTDADTTSLQSTAPKATADPIVPTAVCATVLTALTPAAFAHFFQSLLFDPPLKVIL